MIDPEEYLDEYEYLLDAEFSDYSRRAQFFMRQWTWETRLQVCSAIVNEDIDTLKAIVATDFDYMEVVRTAYRNALWRKNVRIAQFLKRNGATYGLVETVLVGKVSDIMRAITTQQFEQQELLQSYRALFWGRRHLVKKVLPMMMAHCPIPIDTVQSNGNTLLHDLICQPAIPFASALLNLEGDCDQGGNWGMTPLMYVACQGDVILAKELLGRGANINKQDNEGYTALTHSIYEQHNRMTHLFLEAGSDVNILDKAGRSPLMIALLVGTPRAVGLLLQYGADKSFKYQGKPLTEVLEHRKWAYGKQLIRKLLTDNR